MFEFITKTIAESGYPGIFFLMVIENVFPPIPSELIMPLAGFTAASGDLNIMLVVAAGTAGSIAGTLPWYFAGLYFGQKRLRRAAKKHGRWLTVSPKDIDVASDWYQQHGWRAVLYGRLLPAVRTLISVPAGIMEMRMPAFIMWSTIGSLLWTGLLAATGFLLESQYQAVARYMDPVTKIILALLIASYVYRLFTYDSRQAK